MKKIIAIGLFLIMAAGYTASSQGNYVWSNPVNNLLLVNKDTMIKVSVSENYAWISQLYWRANTDTVKFSVYASCAKKPGTVAPADSLFIRYSGIASDVLSVMSSGSKGFDDIYGLTPSWIAYKIEATDSVYVYLFTNYKKK